MGLVNLVLLAAGIALLLIGGVRLREPYRRYTALRVQEANLSRYDSWRGGSRTAVPDTRPSSATLMQAELRRQAQRWGLLCLGGFVLLFLAFTLR
ncbi:MAG: hypothetical protein ACRDF7_10160 [Candidatus Limnocylindrales bacterium]